MNKYIQSIQQNKGGYKMLISKDQRLIWEMEMKEGVLEVSSQRLLFLNHLFDRSPIIFWYGSIPVFICNQDGDLKSSIREGIIFDIKSISLYLNLIDNTLEFHVIQFH